jgi:hypothetical protein
VARGDDAGSSLGDRGLVRDAVALVGRDQSDVIKVLRALPLVADRLDAIGVSTSELPKMRAGIDALDEDTGRPRRSRRSVSASIGWRV